MTGRALTMEELERSRYARFELNPLNRSEWLEGMLPLLLGLLGMGWVSNPIVRGVS